MKLRRSDKCRAIVSSLSILVFSLSLLPAVHGQGASGPKLSPHSITLADGRTFSLNLPEDFDISVAAEGLKRIRFMAKGPDGRIFVTDMHDLSDNSLGSIYILDGFDPRTGKFKQVIPYLRRLRNPNSIAFYSDPTKQNWLYVALTDKLERYHYHLGESFPMGTPEVLATYPDYGLSYKYGGWHLTRTIAFSDSGNSPHLYISVGSSCNACEEKEEVRATISVMDPDGKHARILASGLRNAVGLRFVNGTLFATNMGADHLGDDAPDETMFALGPDLLESNKRLHYGWPYCYFKDGRVLADPRFAASPKKADCAQVPAAFTTFAAHGSPLGLEYFDSSTKDPALQNSFLVALHGSSKRRLGRGYRVALVREHSKPQDFITGFLENGVVHGRPCDIFRLGPDSFLVTDDYNGVIYYVHHK
jgi:glucose/arabinose dehydrogenase